VEKQPKKKLTWVYTQGTMVIAATYGEKTSYEITCATLQGLVLLLFDSKALEVSGKDKLSLADAKELSGIQDSQFLQAALESICVPPKSSAKIPRVVEKVKEGNKSTYILNERFASKARKFALCSFDGMKQGTEKATVAQNRTHNIDSYIVRTMKTRKISDHASLVAEVLSQGQAKGFKPEPKDIKRQIESLIGREYLKRDEQDAKVYVYLP